MPPVCSCKIHDDININVKTKVYKISSKKFKKSVVEALQSAGHLYDRAIYLCTGCANHAEQQLITNPDNETVDEIINLIKNNKLSKNNLQKLLKAIVESEISDIYEDCSEIQTLYKNDSFLASANICDWVTRRNSLVLTFLLSIVNRDISNISSEECTLLAFAIENIYFMMKKNLVLPFTFAKNLLT